jgi:hypothetical protein
MLGPNFTQPTTSGVGWRATMTVGLLESPEQGQLVSVRSRNWIVNEVVLGTLPAGGVQAISEPQTLVSLASVEDDRLGEEIQIVWELEPGARPIEKVAVL